MLCTGVEGGSKERSDRSLLKGDATSALLLGEGDLLLHVFRDRRQQWRLNAVAILVRDEGEGGDGAVREAEAVEGRDELVIEMYREDAVITFCSVMRTDVMEGCRRVIIAITE